MIKHSLMKKENFFSNISEICNINNLDSIYDLAIAPKNYSTLLYNTNDLFLNQKQFEVLLKLCSNSDTIYVAQHDSDEVYEICLPISYEDYKSLDLYSITYLSSKEFKWVIVIDEELESGVGVLISNTALINDFNSVYQDELKDLFDLISFYFRDASRNPLSIQNMIKVLSLLHISRM